MGSPRPISNQFSILVYTYRAELGYRCRFLSICIYTTTYLVCKYIFVKKFSQSVPFICASKEHAVFWHEDYKNSKTGVKGVSPCGSGYQAQIRINWKNIYLGIFPTIEEAKAVYDKAAIELHGEFARV